MKRFIEKYISREESLDRETLEDMERWERYKLSGHSIAQDEIEAWLSTWGSENELPCPK